MARTLTRYRRPDVIRLYHRPQTGRPARVRWALEEAGAPYEYVVMSREEAAGPEHMLRHPLGRVPVLESEDGFLFESAALCLQIADAHPDANLIPAPGTHERGQVYQWTIFAMSELEPAVIRVYHARQATDDDATAAGRERLAKVVDALERRLDGRDYLVADRFTIADVVIGGVLSTAKRLELVPAGSGLNAYLDRLDSRAAKQRAYAS
jgi:glutathione S-transferase